MDFIIEPLEVGTDLDTTTPTAIPPVCGTGYKCQIGAGAFEKDADKDQK